MLHSSLCVEGPTQGFPPYFSSILPRLRVLVPPLQVALHGLHFRHGSHTQSTTCVKVSTYHISPTRHHLKPGMIVPTPCCLGQFYLSMHGDQCGDYVLDQCLVETLVKLEQVWSILLFKYACNQLWSQPQKRTEKYFLWSGKPTFAGVILHFNTITYLDKVGYCSPLSLRKHQCRVFLHAFLLSSHEYES